MTSPERTYASIQQALDAYQRWPAGIDYDVYLQGSYPNHTNVRADSDVDVVVQLNSTFTWNDYRLNETERGLLRATITPAVYRWENFREDVLLALRNRYSVGSVRETNNCLEVVRGTTLGAHVVPALELRIYYAFRNVNDYTVVQGIQFWRRDGVRIQNFPKQHIDNGAAKNQATRTRELYKPAIRMFKNARRRLIDQRIIAEGLAPSYCIECLLYNIPDAQYAGSFQDIFCNVVNHLHSANLGAFHCQNEQDILFGNQPRQWSIESARTFINGLITLWNNWS